MKRRNSQSGVAWALTILWLFLSLSCSGPEMKPSPDMPFPSKPAPQVEAPSPPPSVKPAPKMEPTAENFIHEVKWSGESLSIIAGWYTGDIQNWKALSPFNPHVKPDVIRLGDRIVIPRSMMKTQEPMPKSYLETFVPQAGGQAQPSPSEAKPPKDEPKLFGPKPLPKK